MMFDYKHVSCHRKWMRDREGQSTVRAGYKNTGYKEYLSSLEYFCRWPKSSFHTNPLDIRITLDKRIDLLLANDILLSSFDCIARELGEKGVRWGGGGGE